MKLAIGAFLMIFLLIVLISVNSQIDSTTSSLKFPTIAVNIPGQGSVLGNFDTTLWSNQTFMQFRGIPFAESPSGKLRFKPPVARLPWRQTLYATKYGKRCPVITSVEELSEDKLKQDLEDCLNLCVYTKNLTAKQPVMFYIYGGGFYNGSASDHPPRHLLEKNIVLVVPQYRIGALGWLSTLTDNMPGNAPVGDLLLALEWVQKYIGQFGGDAENVTVFGQSAGAAMTGALMLSPITPTGFFQRAITQSGSILGSWAINTTPREQVARICRTLECGACEEDEEMYRCLREVSVRRLLEATLLESFSPIVGDINGILPQHPAVLLEQFNKAIPVMAGFTKHDGSFVLATYYDAMKKVVGNLNYVSVRQFADGMLDLANDTTRLSNNLMTRLLFTPELLNSYEHKKAIPAYFDLVNIGMMKSPIIALTSQLVRKQLAHTYLYSFDYDGENTRFGYEFGNEHYPFEGGVHHSNDNIYLFSTHALNAADTEMAKRMVELWTSFAIDGVPSVAKSPTILPMKFENGPYFHINSEITIGDDVLQELTATIDDPDSNNLVRENIEF